MSSSDPQIIKMVKQVNKNEKGTQPKISCYINGYKIKATIDTGSFNSIMSRKIAENLNLIIEQVNNIFPNLQGVSGTNLEIIGIINTSVTIDKKCFDIRFVVINNINDDTLLLGLIFFAKFKSDHKFWY